METGVRVQWVQGNGMGTPIEKILSLDPGLLSLNLVGPRSLDSNQGDFEYYAGDMNLLFIGNRVCWACQGGAHFPPPSRRCPCQQYLYVLPPFFRVAVLPYVSRFPSSEPSLIWDGFI